MAREPMIDTLRTMVAQAERVRLEMLEGLRRTPEGERDASWREMAMFYGRTFSQFMDALSRPLDPRSRAMSVLHAAIQGRADFELWQGTQPTGTQTEHLEQPTGAATEHLDRLEEHWAQLTRIVLEEPE